MRIVRRSVVMLTTLRKKHSKAEIAAKLVQANALAGQGVVQRQIARTIGVSVMTLHRWRKIQGEHHVRIVELKTENARLRRLVTDLLLEKMELEEDAHGNTSPLRGRVRTTRFHAGSN
jgi:putative transposase